jgi:acyl dehydratase
MIFKEKIKITDELIKEFAKLTGDYNPIHLDDEYANNTIFNKRIAHGMLVTSFISRIIAQVYPGEGSIYVSQSFDFLKPCYIDDILEYSIELEKQEKHKYYLIINIINQTGNLILTGKSLIINYKK